MRTLGIGPAGLIDLQTRIGNRTEHDQPAEARFIGAASKALTTQIAKLEAANRRQAQASRRVRRARRHHPKHAGLGDTATAGVAAFMARFRRVDKSAAAALLGVAPYDDDSVEIGTAPAISVVDKLRKLLFADLAPPARIRPSRPTTSLLAMGKRRKLL